MRGFRIEMFFHPLQHFRDAFEGNFGPEQMKQLDKTAHVRALVFMGQIDIHVDGGDRMLSAVSSV